MSETSQQTKIAWVAGASGLVGSHLMRLLCQHPSYHKVVAFVRSPCDADWATHDKVAQWSVNYDELTAPPGVAQVDDLYCALGTTRRKTPNNAAYYNIDVNYPLNFARLGLQQGASRYALVSAHGANADSFSNYLKMKGELEQALQALDFAQLVIARPSLLKGKRGEWRMIERLSELVLNHVPGNLRAIHAVDVASALIRACNSSVKDNPPLQILESSQMQGCDLSAECCV